MDINFAEQEPTLVDHGALHSHGTPLDKSTHNEGHDIPIEDSSRRNSVHESRSGSVNSFGLFSSQDTITANEEEQVELPSHWNLTELAVFAAAAPVIPSATLLAVPTTGRPSFSNAQLIKYKDQPILWLAETAPTMHLLKTAASIPESLHPNRNPLGFAGTPRRSFPLSSAPVRPGLDDPVRPVATGEATMSSGRRVKKRKFSDDFFDESDDEYHENAPSSRNRNTHGFGQGHMGEYSAAASLLLAASRTPHMNTANFKRIKNDPGHSAAHSAAHSADTDGEDSADESGDDADGALQLKVKCNCRIRLPNELLDAAVVAMRERVPVNVVACAFVWALFAPPETAANETVPLFLRLDVAKFPEASFLIIPDYRICYSRFADQLFPRAVAARDGVPLYPCVEDPRPKVAMKGHTTIFPHCKLELGDDGGVYLFAHVGCKGPCDARREEAALTKIQVSWITSDGRRVDWISPKCKISCNRTTGKRRTNGSARHHHPN